MIQNGLLHQSWWSHPGRLPYCYSRTIKTIIQGCHPFTRSNEASNLWHQKIGIILSSPHFFHKKTENPRRKKSMHWMPSQPIENSTQLSGWDCRTVFDSEIRYFSRSCQNSSSNFSASTLISCQEKFWKISSHISKSQAPYRESIWKNNKTTWRWLIFRWKEYQRFSA